MTKLFVYGILKSSKGNFMNSHNAKFIGKATSLLSNYHMVTTGNFPIVAQIWSSKSDYSPHYINGEIWEVNNETLKICDAIEQHPNWYKRIRQDFVLTKSGKYEEAFIYIQPSENLKGYKSLSVNARNEQEF